MGGGEILFRVGRAAQAQLQRLGVGLANAPRPSAALGRPWVAQIPRQFNATEYLAAADRILSGKFDLFAMHSAELGFPPCWNRDPRTGMMLRCASARRSTIATALCVGEIKYLWELNRHLELVTLAQAWHVSRQPRYAHACCELLQSWFDQCPYPLGVNWTSSLEHGIRLVNWAVAWHLLQSSPVFSQPGRQEFVARWQVSVYQHCHFIKHYHSRHSSANNHLLGELGELLVASLTWPCWPESSRWADEAQQEFEEQCLLQTFPDGVNCEQATWYHHEVVDMMLIVGLYARANGRDFGSSYWERLERMLEFIASIMDVAGHVPAFGDADDAVLVRFCPGQSTNVYRSLLAAGGLLFDRSEFCAKAGPPGRTGHAGCWATRPWDDTPVWPAIRASCPFARCFRMAGTTFLAITSIRKTKYALSPTPGRSAICQLRHTVTRTHCRSRCPVAVTSAWSILGLTHTIHNLSGGNIFAVPRPTTLCG